MGQASPTAGRFLEGYEVVHHYKSGPRPLTFSDEIGPMARARALVAQALDDDPLPALLAQFQERLAMAMGEPYSPLLHLRSPRSYHSPHTPSPRSFSPGGRLARVPSGGEVSLRRSESASSSMLVRAAPLRGEPRGVEGGGGTLSRGSSGSWSTYLGMAKSGSEAGEGGALVAVAEAEHDWLVARFERAGTSVKDVAPSRVQEAYVAGLACWLEFWQQWGDGPPPLEANTSSRKWTASISGRSPASSPDIVLSERSLSLGEGSSGGSEMELGRSEMDVARAKETAECSESTSDYAEQCNPKTTLKALRIGTSEMNLDDSLQQFGRKLKVRVKPGGGGPAGSDCAGEVREGGSAERRKEAGGGSSGRKNPQSSASASAKGVGTGAHCSASHGWARRGEGPGEVPAEEAARGEVRTGDIEVVGGAEAVGEGGAALHVGSRRREVVVGPTEGGALRTHPWSEAALVDNAAAGAGLQSKGSLRLWLQGEAEGSLRVGLENEGGGSEGRGEQAQVPVPEQPPAGSLESEPDVQQGQAKDTGVAATLANGNPANLRLDLSLDLSLVSEISTPTVSSVEGEGSDKLDFSEDGGDREGEVGREREEDMEGKGGRDGGEESSGREEGGYGHRATVGLRRRRRRYWSQSWGSGLLSGWTQGWALANGTKGGGTELLGEGETWAGPMGAFVFSVTSKGGSKPGTPTAGILKWMAGGPQGTLQQALLAEALLDDGALVVPPSQAEVLRVLGLAASVSEWQPTAACACVLRLLERLGGPPPAAKDPKSSRAERQETRNFVLACLFDILDSCGTAGGGPGGVAPGKAPSRCPLPREDLGEPWRVGPAVSGSELPAKGQRTAGTGEEPEEAGPPVWKVETEILHLSELAELAVTDMLATSSSGDRSDICQKADRLHRMEIGPGVTAGTLAVLMQELVRLQPLDVLAIAAKFDEMGCSEAGFRVRLLALATPQADVSKFEDIIPQAFQERGYESVPARVARLFSAANQGLSKAPSYAERYAYAKSFSSALLRPLVANPDYHWGFEIAQTFFQLSGHLGPMAPEEAAAHESNVGLCAKVLTQHLVKTLPEEDQGGGLVQWIETTRDPRGTVGWFAWVAIGRMLEREDANHDCLPLMWSRAVVGTYKAINQEGTGVENDALATFDWGLESILMTLPSGDAAVPELLRALGPLPRSRSSLLLAIAARMACTIYWRWPRRKEAAQFVARLLKHAHDTEGMEGGERQWAIAVALRLWGWTMPSPDALSSRCETEEEAKEIMDAAIIATWNSIATWEGEGPITCVGEKWPF